MDSWLILAILVFFGIWISYFDIKKGKIKNSSLLIFLLAAICANFFYTKSFVEFPAASLLNIGYGIALALIIWTAGLWSAADAKLFMVINVLFPVNFYSGATTSFPGLSLFVNSSLILFLFLFFQIMAKTNFQQKKDAFLKHFKFSFLFGLFLRIAAIYSVVIFISSFVDIFRGRITWIVFFLFFSWLIEQKMKLKLKYFFPFLLSLIALLSIVFEVHIFSIYFLYRNLMLFSLFFVFYILLDLGASLFSRPVQIEDLEEGMIPAEMVFERKNGFSKQPVNFFTFLSLLSQRMKWKALIGFNPDGLEKEELEELQSLYRKKLFSFESLMISIAIPFAPILFIGSLITYFLRQTVSF